jgi:Leucine-rich repeat (LRR) protein
VKSESETNNNVKMATLSSRSRGRGPGTGAGAGTSTGIGTGTGTSMAAGGRNKTTAAAIDSEDFDNGSSGNWKPNGSLGKEVAVKVDDGYDIQDILDGIIGEDYLLKVTAASDLSMVTCIKLTVDTSIQSIHAIDELVPNLQELVLDGSVVSSVRDLGVGLRNLRSLSLAHCSISDLDGIGALQGLQILNLSDNSVSEVISLAMHDNLEVRCSVRS